MKWSWEHAKEMGLQFEEVTDGDGNVLDYEGHFLYADRGTLNTIEDVAVYIADLLDEQAKGNLPFDMCFSGIVSVLYLVIYQYVLIRITTNGTQEQCLLSLVII